MVWVGLWFCKWVNRDIGGSAADFISAYKGVVFFIF